MFTQYKAYSFEIVLWRWFGPGRGGFFDLFIGSISDLQHEEYFLSEVIIRILH